MQFGDLVMCRYHAEKPYPALIIGEPHYSQGDVFIIATEDAHGFGLSKDWLIPTGVQDIEKAHEWRRIHMQNITNKKFVKPL